MSETTRVHLVRHGEVHNPTGVLYGRLPGFHLSDRGREMAERLGEVLGERDITHLVASPLDRAQETAAPLAAFRGLSITTDPRVIEAGNRFEGRTFGVGDGSLRRPAVWPLLVNPFRPSWGEPYDQIAQRMRAAVTDARAAARGHEAAIVSHQLPVWVARCSYEGRRLWHDPRTRQCSLASVTTLVWEGDRLARIEYLEPCLDLLPAKAGYGA
ncbi:broad specificity phosphatase PhoE [Motilibacter rhizosphaerae]|uniref:Broad specificity phosphatase PhoE n=1 Tax=Motilibacter rhizosphaerae TaxID=598652 RepID=A0A4Q7NAE8_9ACTN|nr:histidine phosphatase family protein [Motilibacter rhizosphaerae]RZS79047.1 broad specificity phosphatase PhoE [Motilibacter rhizosphaerae]